MTRQSRLWVLLLSSLAVLHAGPVRAANEAVEDKARELQRRAIQEDNLNIAYPEAVRKLSTALNMCTRARCTTFLRASLLRDLGAMHFLEGSVEEGKTYFDRALALKPALSLDRSYSTREMAKAWAEVKQARRTSAPVDNEPSPSASPPAASAGQGTNVAVGGEVPEAPPPARRFWVGVWGSVDFVIAPTANQTCLLQPSLLPVNTVGYYCTDAQGNDFPSRSDGGTQNSMLNTNPQDGDSINRGGALGDVRLGLSFDYALGDNVLLGARAAGLLLSYPGQAAHSNGAGFPAPLHFEARFTYVIGPRALTRPFAPLLFVNAGVGEYDGAKPVRVWLSNGNGSQSAYMVDAWAVGGPAFAGAGAGFRVLFSPRVALTVIGKFEESFGGRPPPLPSVAPEVGVAYGL